MKVEERQTFLQLPNTAGRNELSNRREGESAEAIQTWIVSYLSTLLEIPSEQIECDVPFDAYGLDSSAAIGLTGDLEDWLGQEVDPTLLYDYPTVEALADYLAEAEGSSGAQVRSLS